MTRTLRITRSTFVLLGLTTLLACGGNGGGGGGAPSSNSLSYTDPTTGDYRLVRDASSSARHLVLDLVGPVSTDLSGVGFYLTADTDAISWGAVEGSAHVASAFFSNAPLVASKITQDELQAGVYQKGPGAAFQTIGVSTVLAQVALDLRAGVAENTEIALTAPAGKAQILNKPGLGPKTTPIAITVGTLVAN